MHNETMNRNARNWASESRESEVKKGKGMTKIIWHRSPVRFCDRTGATEISAEPDVADLNRRSKLDSLRAVLNPENDGLKFTLRHTSSHTALRADVQNCVLDTGTSVIATLKFVSPAGPEFQDVLIVAPADRKREFSAFSLANFQSTTPPATDEIVPAVSAAPPDEQSVWTVLAGVAPTTEWRRFAEDYEELLIQAIATWAAARDERWKYFPHEDQDGLDSDRGLRVGVGEVNGEGARLVRGFHPTMHELLVLAQYWKRRHWELQYDIQGVDVEAAYTPLTRFATARVQQIRELAGESETDKALDEVTAEFKKTMSPEEWPQFVRCVASRNAIDRIRLNPSLPRSSGCLSIDGRGRDAAVIPDVRCNSEGNHPF